MSETATTSPAPSQPNKKKPFYKKWWVWVIVIMVLAAAAGGDGGVEGKWFDVTSNNPAVINLGSDGECLFIFIKSGSTWKGKWAMEEGGGFINLTLENAAPMRLKVVHKGKDVADSKDELIDTDTGHRFSRKSDISN